MTTIEPMSTRVARGAAWLDRVRPGWRASITPDALLMNEGCSCVCGHVFVEEGEDYGDGFAYAVEKFADNGDWDVRHGFTLVAQRHGHTERWADLEAEWLRVIGVPTTDRPLRHCAHV